MFNVFFLFLYNSRFLWIIFAISHDFSAISLPIYIYICLSCTLSIYTKKLSLVHITHILEHVFISQVRYQFLLIQTRIFLVSWLLCSIDQGILISIFGLSYKFYRNCLNEHFHAVCWFNSKYQRQSGVISFIFHSNS